MNLKKVIVETLKEEVVPAMGCTEPVSVALACAKCKELIEYREINRINVLVSPNIYKNGLAVGIPNTEEVGLYIAAALGIIGGNSKNDLNVLEDITQEDVKLAKSLLNSGKLSLQIKNTEEKIYIEVEISTDNGSSKTIIKKKHNNFVYMESQGEVLLDFDSSTTNNSTCDMLYNEKITDIVRAIEEIPYEDIEFMLKGLEMNRKMALEGLKDKVGMGVGYSLKENIKKGILSDDLMTHSMILTSGASDARMSGVNLPVMSSNGSGNNGLTAILPLVAYQDKFEVNNKELAKALAISHIINSYIKYHIGRLSALCGCGVAAGTGASVAIAWLMGANDKQIDGAINNMIGNTSGMICDGAKEGCALKLASSASAAIQSALLAINDSIIAPRNGIVAKSPEETIKNLSTLSMKGMNFTDNVILNIMRSMETDESENPNLSKKVAN